MLAVWIVFGILILASIVTIFILVLTCSSKQFKLIPREEGTTWPKHIFLTYTKKEKVPQKICDDLKTFASDFELRFSDDRQAEEFIETNMPLEVLDTYKKLKLGAHRADLWRYCVLWHYGGVYLDIKTHLIKPVSSMFPDNRKNYTVLSAVNPNACHQGILVVRPGSDAMKKAIEKMVNVGPKKINKEYGTVIRQLYGIVYSSTKEKFKWKLFQEVCTDCEHSSREPDRYGKCYDIVDPSNANSLVCYTRHSDFGNKW